MLIIELLGPFGSGKTTILKKINHDYYHKGVLTSSQALGKIAIRSIHNDSTILYYIILIYIIKVLIALSKHFQNRFVNLVLTKISLYIIINKMELDKTIDYYPKTNLNHFISKVLELINDSDSSPFVKMKTIRDFYSILLPAKIIRESEIQEYVVFDESVIGLIMKIAGFSPRWEELFDYIVPCNIVLHLKNNPDKISQNRKMRGYSIDKHAESKLLNSAKKQVQHCEIISSRLKKIGFNVFDLDADLPVKEINLYVSNIIDSLLYE